MTSENRNPDPPFIREHFIPLIGKKVTLTARGATIAGIYIADVGQDVLWCEWRSGAVEGKIERIPFEDIFSVSWEETVNKILDRRPWIQHGPNQVQVAA